MKKIMNSPDTLVAEALEGLVISFPQYLKQVPGTHVLTRATPKPAGRVGLVSGGGSGHEPAHAGYVGYGMLDAAVAGEVFTSPTPDQVLEGIRVADHGAGVLLVVKNYTGDVMNFDIARELAEAEGIKVATVVVNDDVAVENSSFTTGRRGIAGTIFVHKIAGALAEQGASLEEVEAVANRVIAHVRSMGFALEPCTVPQAGQPTFTLADDEIEMGIGIHGEPGIERQKLRSAHELAQSLLEKIAMDLPLKAGDHLACMVNGMGATPLLELAALAREVSLWSKSHDMPLDVVWTGEFMTSLEMAGASLTLLPLDDTLRTLLAAPCDTPQLRQGVHHD
ncbi:dihydroxyacetone kinase subunit DhaK [Sulfobacillus thermotolerans]|uniref:Dihydroxyacetone kinase subunit DhaK n=1 Tax=Sulfobacillus thermotolerans TaxID=338644 RepID=A0ABN5H4A2_9FIRM|nr:dihydroxyacetone kinase subunit DhaK [Sulfobacillus thermotolerans]